MGQNGTRPQYTAVMARAIKSAMREQWGLADDVTSDDPAHALDSHKIAVAAFDALCAEMANYPPEPNVFQNDKG